jgi:hypothetical protein
LWHRRIPETVKWTHVVVSVVCVGLHSVEVTAVFVNGGRNERNKRNITNERIKNDNDGKR